MENFGKLEINPQSGNETLSNKGEASNTKLIDFWRWGFSDLISNTTRGIFAEFIVHTALDLPNNKVRETWDNYDLETESGVSIEVKSAAYLQTWEQKTYSAISFSIRPTYEWYYERNERSDIKKRQADVYVFCLLKHKDQNTLNPLKMEQWEFYVVPTSVLDQQLPTQKTISLRRLKTIATPIEYAALKEHILAIKKTGN